MPVIRLPENQAAVNPDFISEWETPASNFNLQENPWRSVCFES